jgi:hypothetical protein
MDDMRFADVMQRERERLNRERQEILHQQNELEGKLTEIDRELAAIAAYETAKTGKAVTPAQPPRPQEGSRRETLLQVISAEPSGLRRGEIFERLGLKGNKSAEKSVSNALTALTKNNLVFRREGKYVIGG